MSLVDAAFSDTCGRVGSLQLPKHRYAGLGFDEMADELKRYWFVAAVFREPNDLVSTIAELRKSGVAGNRVVVVANHRADAARKVIGWLEADPVSVVAAHADGSTSIEPSSELSSEMFRLLAAMSDDARRDLGDSHSHVYAQLRQVVAAGSLILIASVADPEEQLLGARVLLRGNCECVLTHEIAA